jgi:hypothetical protein
VTCLLWQTIQIQSIHWPFHLHQVVSHKCLVVPARDGERFGSCSLYARAVSSFHGAPYLGRVAVQAEDKGQPTVDWFAQTRLFVNLKVADSSGAERTKELALVRFYKESAPIDATSCAQLKWETLTPTFKLIPADTILRLIYIVPKFNLPKRFYLNRFLFSYS